MTDIRARPWPTLILLLACAICTVLESRALAQQDAPRISELSYLDRQFMQQQRDLLEELTSRNFGRSFSGDRERDLELLQRLLDQRLVRTDQTRELQAMGVVMGDLLAADLDMHWVIYEDRAGRSRALRLEDSDNYLFPITMISRRQEVGNRKPVSEIYQKARDSILAVKQPLPFQ
jgi:hypothetical protein